MTLFDCSDKGRAICSPFLSPPRGIWQLKSPHPGNLPSKAKKMPGGGGGWAQLELTDALVSKRNELDYSWAHIVGGSS